MSFSSSGSLHVVILSQYFATHFRDLPISCAFGLVLSIVCVARSLLVSSQLELESHKMTFLSSFGSSPLSVLNLKRDIGYS